MFKFLKKKKAQSTLEYAVLIIIVIGALLTIQVYIKRGVQDRMRSSTDDIGDQYDPGNVNYIRHTKVSPATVLETFGVTKAGQKESTVQTAEVTTVSENMILLNAQQSYWGSAEDRGK